MKRVVSYIRVSTSHQVHGHSLKYQKEAIKKYSEYHNLKIVTGYTDAGISAFKERKAFAAAFTRVLDDSEITGIVVNDLTRFGRSAAELATNRTRLEEKGKAFYSVKENIDITSKEGKMLFGMLSVIAEFYRDIIAENTAEGLEYARVHGTRSGKPVGRPRALIDWAHVIELREKNGLSWVNVASLCNVSRAALVRRAREEGIIRKEGGKRKNGKK